MSAGLYPALPAPPPPPAAACAPPSLPTSPDPQQTHMAGVASSGALIRVPSFSRWQNSSLICTPGYGEAPGSGKGEGWVGSGPLRSAQPPRPPLP